MAQESQKKEYGWSGQAIGGSCDVLSIPPEIARHDQLEDWMAELKMIRSYGRFAIKGSTLEVRYHAAALVLGYCGTAVTEIMVEDVGGYRVISPPGRHNPNRWYTLDGSPMALERTGS